MLTKLVVRNFKRFEQVELELGSAVVFVGPNNAGKTAALQALALWDIGVKRWVEKRGIGNTNVPKRRPGVTINRRDLIAIPVPNANLLWRNLHVRDVQRVDGKPRTQNVRIDVIVEGITQDRAWACGMEFDYANEESLYCRPLRLTGGSNPDRMPVSREAAQVQVAYLPPMSGLAANETRLDPGAISVRIGEGRTAEVLRNLCYRLVQGDGGENWRRLQVHIRELFGITLEDPIYIAERGEITMTYRDLSDVRLDLSSSGRGLQQVLLLLAYLYAHPGAVLLLDEPDAHLEILRQRQIYHLLTEVAQKQNGQIIAASHSEVVLNEAADRDIVIAFVGKPHRIDDRGSQLLKSLREIGYDQYYQAEQTGWVLYLEGSTDLAILRALANTLDHPAAGYLERPFIHYVANQPTRARHHFYGLREAQPNLVGVAIFDRIEQALQADASLCEMMWQRREIENYICTPEVLKAYAEAVTEEEVGGPLFAHKERERRRKVMEACIQDLVPPVALRDYNDRWWREVKASDDFLDRLFELYFQRLNLPNLMRKTDYHLLARLVPKELIDEEVKEKLDSIVNVAKSAQRLQENIP